MAEPPPIATGPLGKLLAVVLHVGIAAGLLILFYHNPDVDVIAATLGGIHTALLLGLWGPRTSTKWYWVPHPLHEPLGVLLLFMIGFVHFVGVAIIFFHLEEQWPLIDCLWFSFVLLTTVGYGNTFTPSTANSRVFTLLWSLIGLFIFGAGSSTILDAFKIGFDALWSIALRLVAPRRERVMPLASASALPEVEKFTPPSYYYIARGLYIKFSLFLVLNFGGAGIFWSVEDGWTYLDALYHSLMTATTIGLGDIAPQTVAGRAYGIVHMVLSVTIFASFFGTILNGLSDRKQMLHKQELLRRQLDHELIASLAKDARGVDRTEFVLGMLEVLGVVSEEDYRPFLEQFEQMDRTRDGRLNKDDLYAVVDAKHQEVEAKAAAAKAALGVYGGKVKGLAMQLLMPSFFSAFGFLWYAYFGFILLAGGMVNGLAIGTVIGTRPSPRMYRTTALFAGLGGACALATIVYILVLIFAPHVLLLSDSMVQTALFGVLTPAGTLFVPPQLTQLVALAKADSSSPYYAMIKAQTDAMLNNAGRVLCITYIGLFLYTIVVDVMLIYCSLKAAAVLQRRGADGANGAEGANGAATPPATRVHVPTWDGESSTAPSPADKPPPPASRWKAVASANRFAGGARTRAPPPTAEESAEMDAAVGNALARGDDSAVF